MKEFIRAGNDKVKRRLRNFCLEVMPLEGPDLTTFEVLDFIDFHLQLREVKERKQCWHDKKAVLRRYKQQKLASSEPQPSSSPSPDPGAEQPEEHKVKESVKASRKSQQQEKGSKPDSSKSEHDLSAKDNYRATQSSSSATSSSDTSSAEGGSEYYGSDAR